jgi:hypothetical protein
VLFIELQRSFDRSELTLHVRDHHVLDLELGVGVDGVYIPQGCGALKFRGSDCSHDLFLLIRYTDDRYNDKDSTKNQAL